MKISSILKNTTSVSFFQLIILNIVSTILFFIIKLSCSKSYLIEKIASIIRKLSKKADFKNIQRYLNFYIKIVKQKCMPKPGRIQIEKFNVILEWKFIPLYNCTKTLGEDWATELNWTELNVRKTHWRKIINGL